MLETPLEVAKTLYMLLRDSKGKVTITDIYVGLYLYYGFAVTKNKVNPFNEEPEAWPCGIVFPSVANNFDISDDDRLMKCMPKLIDRNKCVACCVYIINKYLKHDINVIINIMTEQGNNTPWLTSVRDGNSLRSKVNSSVIISWFKENIKV